jgi:hypothetical protein
MIGLEEGAYRVRYGGGGPFRVQLQMSITVTRIEQAEPGKEERKHIVMQRSQERQPAEVDGSWDERRLTEEAQ